MVARLRFGKILILLPLLGILSVADIAAAQETTPLLRLQRSKAYLNLETNVVHAQGMNGITYGKGGDVSSYPNSLACLTVRSDGKYVFEKRDEQTVGKPKVKTAAGTLGADDLQDADGVALRSFKQAQDGRGRGGGSQSGGSRALRPMMVLTPSPGLSTALTAKYALSQDSCQMLPEAFRSHDGVARSP